MMLMLMLPMMLSMGEGQENDKNVTSYSSRRFRVINLAVVKFNECRLNGLVCLGRGQHRKPSGYSRLMTHDMRESKYRWYFYYAFDKYYFVVVDLSRVCVGP